MASASTPPSTSAPPLTPASSSLSVDISPIVPALAMLEV